MKFLHEYVHPREEIIPFYPKYLIASSETFNQIKLSVSQILKIFTLMFL